MHKLFVSILQPFSSPPVQPAQWAHMHCIGCSICSLSLDSNSLLIHKNKVLVKMKCWSQAFRDFLRIENRTNRSRDTALKSWHVRSKSNIMCGLTLT